MVSVLSKFVTNIMEYEIFCAIYTESYAGVCQCSCD